MYIFNNFLSENLGNEYLCNIQLSIFNAFRYSKISQKLVVRKFGFLWIFYDICNPQFYLPALLF